MRRWTLLLVVATWVMGVAGAAPATAGTPVTNGRILYVLDTNTCDDCHLTAIDPDGSDPFRYAVGSSARWSPDGTMIAAVTETDDGRIGTLVMDADGSSATTFEIPDATRNAPCIDWSPDGTKLLCEVWDEVHPRRLPGLFTVSSSDGSGLTRLTTNTTGGHDIAEDFSPDGTQVVFLRENPQRDHRPLAIFVAAADGSGATRITGWLGGSACCQVRWSPDGSQIGFASGGVLRTVHPDGTTAGRILVDAGVDFQFASGLAWSPDGTRIAFTMYVSSTGSEELYTANADDGSGLQRITNTSRHFKGSPDWGTYPTT
jgi:Tol biopolymer transport system component